MHLQGHAYSGILRGSESHHHQILSLRLLVNIMILWLTSSVSWNYKRISTYSRPINIMLYLNSSAGIDMLLMKAIPLLALLVLWKWRENDLLSNCGPEVRVWMWGCDCVPGQIPAVTFSMLLWCFCSLSRSVGRATLMNLWIGASRRLSVSLLPSSAMCPADCPQPTPLCNLDSAPAQLYLTAPTYTVNTSRVWF